MDSLKESNKKNYLRLRIDNIINDYINPALSGHNGKIELISIYSQPHQVHITINYEGNCSNCTSSITETLSMIEALFNEELQELFGKIIVKLPQEYIARQHEFKEYSLIG